MSQSYREKEMVQFAAMVASHIRSYTVPRYGDWPEDLATDMTLEQGIGQIKKYAQRFGHDARGDERQADMIKIAHYACMIYWIIEGEKQSE